MPSIRSITLVGVKTQSTLPDRLPNNDNAGRPTMCRSCGSIVGAGQKQCAVCGTSVTSSASATKSRPVPDRETLRFARAVLGRPYKFTIILLVSNVFIYLLMLQASGMTFSVLGVFPPQVLVPFGAKLNFLIRTEHQWWRFVTPMFLHVNILHLMVNMYSLWIVGPYVEKLYGSAKFVVFWAFTGIAAVAASYFTVVGPDTRLAPLGRFLFKVEDAPSAGASGALFGLVGVLFVFGIKFRHELPEGFKRAFGTGLIPMIMLNLFIGYLGRGFIDNAAHLGGLASGAMLALVVDYRRPGEKSGIAITWRILQIAAIALVAVSFVKTAQHYRDPLPASIVQQRVPSTDARTENFVSYVKAMNNAQETFYLSVKDGNVSGVDRAVKGLDAAPQLDPTADELKEKMKVLLLEAKDTQVVAKTSNGSPSRNAQEEQTKLRTDFVKWSKEYNKWLKTSGRNYSGLVDVPETESSPK
jgi:rhomboid protease GluP